MYNRIVICSVLFVVGWGLANLFLYLQQDSEVDLGTTLEGQQAPAVQRLSERVVPTSDKAKRLEELLSEELPTEENQEELQGILSALVEEDPSYLISLFRNGVLHRDHAPFLEAAVIRQVAHSPSFFATLPREIDNWVGREMWSVALGELARTDPQGAIAHYEKAGFLDRSVLETIYEAWQEVDPDTAWMEYWDKHYAIQENETNDILYRKPPDLFTTWVHQRPQAAFEWIRDTQMLPHRKRSLVRAMIEGMEPSQGAMLSENIGELNELAIDLGIGSQEAALKALALANEDPEAGIELARDIPQLDQNQRALERIIDQVMLTDPEKAIEYASTLPSRRVRGKAYAAYGSMIAVEDPEAAMEWVQAIEEEEVKGTALTGVITTWSGQDLGAALESLALSKSAYDYSVWEYFDTITTILEGADHDDFFQPTTVSGYERIWETLDGDSQSQLKTMLERRGLSEDALGIISGKGSPE